MQNEAYKLTGFTAVISALGFLLRWLQNLWIIDEETGLAVRGAGISWAVGIFIAVVIMVLLWWCVYLRRYETPTGPEEALSGRTFLYTVMGMIPVVLLAVSGVLQLAQADLDHWAEGQVTIHRICGVATLAASFGVGLVITGASKPEKATARRIGAALIVLFNCLWLITVYKSAAADPVLWRCAVQVLGICGALIATYYVAGYYFDEPHPLVSLFFCEVGAFLCVMAAIDEQTLAQSLCFVSMAVLLLTWGFTITANLRRAKRSLLVDEDSEEPEGGEAAE